MQIERVPSQLFEAATPSTGAMTDKRDELPLTHDAPAAVQSVISPEALASFRSSLSGPALALPFASLRLPALPLLSRGSGNSSSHLGLVAIDPETSVLAPDVLLRMKLQFVQGGCKVTHAPLQMTMAEAAADALPEVPALPSHGRSLRKRKSSSRAETAAPTHRSTRSKSMKHKKARKLALVPTHSLLTLHKQLSREQQQQRDSSAVQAESELAAFALARHLVDWSEQFDLEGLAAGGDSDDEEAEQEQEQEEPVKLASPAFAAEEIRSTTMARGAAEWQSPDVVATEPLSACSAAVSTPAFEPELTRAASSRTQGLDVLDEQAPTPAMLPASFEEELLLQGEAQEQQEQQEQLQLGQSPLFQFNATLEQPHSQHMLSPLALPLCMSPLLQQQHQHQQSSKASPALLAHLASPDFLGDTLPHLALDGGMHQQHQQQQRYHHADFRLTLAATTTSAGARVELQQAGW